ncbi:ATP-dependent sacrificial sulfur transferase LarE [Faecalispora jeddahensis]|uniref:ATP-dependent sacrificial sulfur transferase LarE n=1 Tax=Faecalispora jeddahensis TaxID=1414721 RepID=UPI0028B21EA5|nr:ATP-dependent sacrificial sulfur transferase LarE [Faecalispora jeddahensis]
MTLEHFFQENPSGALAFSGGTDSSYLVWAAKKYGTNWHAYFVKSAFQPEFELDDARKIAQECGLPLTIIRLDVLSNDTVVANPANRCYYCKQTVFSAILHQAKLDGLDLVIDGTNASDDVSDRPGMKALQELKVRSPLRECGLTKSEVRGLAREAGLFVWNKPSYSCLATRIPTGTALTAELLEKAEHCESLVASLGFQNFRIRLRGDLALLQFTSDQFSYAFERRETIRELLSPYCPIVALDLLPRAKAN